MGKRLKMPLCLRCGKRLRHRYNDYHRFETALEKATLMAVHREKVPRVRYDFGDYGTALANTRLRDRGYVTTLRGRGWWGLNTFCGTYCAQSWLRSHNPEAKWER